MKTKSHSLIIEEFGGWNNKEKRWWLLYYIPRKPIFTEFIKHTKKFHKYHRWTWKIDTCVKIHFNNKIYPKWMTLVCTQWYKTRGHLGFYFYNQYNYKNFLDHVKTFSYKNTVFACYL